MLSATCIHIYIVWTKRDSSQTQHMYIMDFTIWERKKRSDVWIEREREKKKETIITGWAQLTLIFEHSIIYRTWYMNAVICHS